MHKCGKSNCKICSYVSTGKVIKATYTNASVQLSKSFDCQTSNIVYIVGCKKCNDQYIGQTKKTLEDRFKQHLGYVANNINATGTHFNSPGHSRSDMTISVLEKVSRIDRNLRETRESTFIEMFNLTYRGMNKKR